MAHSETPLLCRFRLHRWEEIGLLSLVSMVERCTRCGRGRVFHALSMSYTSLTDQQLADVLETRQIVTAMQEAGHDGR